MHTSNMLMALAANMVMVAAQFPVLPFINPTAVVSVSQVFPSESSAIAAAYTSYQASLLSNPSVASELAILASALPAACVPAAPSSAPKGGLSGTGFTPPEECLDTTTPAWFAALPTQVQDLAHSIYAVEANMWNAAVSVGGTPSVFTAFPTAYESDSGSAAATAAATSAMDGMGGDGSAASGTSAQILQTAPATPSATPKVNGGARVKTTTGAVAALMGVAGGVLFFL